MTTNERTTYITMVGNMKGGVGKTTNSVNLGRALTERGRKVLIVDLDTQAGATRMLGVPTAGWNGAFELLTGSEPPAGCIVDDTEEEFSLPKNLHLIPSSRELADLDKFLALPDNKWLIHQDLLLKPMELLRGQYDHIILDTPPNPESRTILPAMKVADFVVLSAQPNALAVSALGDAMEDIKIARRGPNPTLRLLGIVVCAIPRPQTVLARTLLEHVTESCRLADGSSLKFDPDISRSTVVEEATQQCQTILDWAGSHTVADQYRELAKNFEARIAEWTKLDGESPAEEPAAVEAGEGSASPTAAAGDSLTSEATNG